MKIMYFIAGEGMGHMIRSRSIIDELNNEHEVKVFCGESKAHYFTTPVNKIPSFRIIYRNNKVMNLFTFFYNLAVLPKMFKEYFKISKMYDEFKPDLIITDFEPIGSYLAMNKKAKCLTIDNQHIISNCNINFKFSAQKMLSKLAIFLTVPYSTFNLILTYFHPKLKKDNSKYFNPVVRENVRNLKSMEGLYYLVYQTSDSNKNLLEELKKIDEKFIVYGFHKDLIDGNLTLKSNNEDTFFNDLANCKSVITNGGFTLISEALFLKKPILSIPIKKQFEQVVNAHYLDKLGYGMSVSKFTKERFDEFKHKSFQISNFTETSTVSDFIKTYLNE
tara:strand:+ start:717 stop:1715 length:999 start_codon:yes stop_codon:yes gene_type:complete